MLGLLKMCYTCLATDNSELIDLSNMDLDSITFLYKLETCVTSQLEESSLKQICPSCMKQLRISYRFREMVLLSQETLSKHKNEIMSGTYIVKSELNEFKMEIKNELLESECDFKQNGSSIRTRATRLRNKKINLSEDFVELSLDHNENDSDSSDYFLSELKNGEKHSDSNSNDNTNVSEKTEEKYDNYVNCDIKDAKGEKDDSKEEMPNKRRRGRPRKRIKDTKPDLQYECFHCSMVFNKRWKLQKHITRVHSISKKYICTYCNKGFKQSYHLREHLTSHTGERNYTCSFCDKSFQRISSMRRHIRSHEAAPGQKTKRTPFLCTVCGKSFPFSNGVQRHMRIHLGIKNHECSVCHRKFTQSTHLHVHMRTHTGEKPYICDTCGEAFALNASLQKHMTVHQNANRNTLLILKS